MRVAKEFLLVIGFTLFFLGLAWGIPAYRLLFAFLAFCIGITALYGPFLVRVFGNQSHLLTLIFGQAERKILSFLGGWARKPMTWQQYSLSLILFHGLAGILLFAILMAQFFLPFNPLHFAGIEPFQAFNIVCGFLGNTDWQSYSGEMALSNFSQMTAITYGMAIGAVSGIAVFIAFIRGLTGRPLGNFFRTTLQSFLYILLPVMILATVVFIALGVPQTLDQQVVAHSLEGPIQKIAVGPVATLETLKLFGTNGGGFFNANSAHPFENPSPLANLMQILLEMTLPLGLVYVFGAWLNSRKQGWLIWGSMMLLLVGFFAVSNTCEQQGNALLSAHHVSQAHTAWQSGGNMEGKEVRFGILPSMLFTTVTTSTSTGAVNTMHDSLTPIGGLMPLLDLMLNVIFSGVGVGLMNFLLYGVLAVFLTGLMVGRTPEMFGKKLEKPEMVLAAIVLLIHPILSLLPTAIAVTNSFGLASLGNPGAHGFSEILYAYTSASADNGSAFAGLNTNTPWYNLSIGVVILLSRYIPITALLAIAGSLSAKPRIATSVGTLKTDTLLFMAVWMGTILIVGALTFVPALVLGPILEHLGGIR